MIGIAIILSSISVCASEIVDDLPQQFLEIDGASPLHPASPMRPIRALHPQAILGPNGKPLTQQEQEVQQSLKLVKQQVDGANKRLMILDKYVRRVLPCKLRGDCGTMSGLTEAKAGLIDEASCGYKYRYNCAKKFKIVGPAPQVAAVGLEHHQKYTGVRSAAEAAQSGASAATNLVQSVHGESVRSGDSTQYGKVIQMASNSVDKNSNLWSLADVGSPLPPGQHGKIAEDPEAQYNAHVGEENQRLEDLHHNATWLMELSRSESKPMENSHPDNDIYAKSAMPVMVKAPTPPTGNKRLRGASIGGH